MLFFILTQLPPRAIIKQLGAHLRVFFAKRARRVGPLVVTEKEKRVGLRLRPRLWHDHFIQVALARWHKDAHIIVFNRHAGPEQDVALCVDISEEARHGAAVIAGVEFLARVECRRAVNGHRRGRAQIGDGEARVFRGGGARREIGGQWRVGARAVENALVEALHAVLLVGVEGGDGIHLGILSRRG